MEKVTKKKKGDKNDDLNKRKINVKVTNVANVIAFRLKNGKFISFEIKKSFILYCDLSVGMMKMSLALKP